MFQHFPCNFPKCLGINVDTHTSGKTNVSEVK